MLSLELAIRKNYTNWMNNPYCQFYGGFGVWEPYFEYWTTLGELQDQLNDLINLGLLTKNRWNHYCLTKQGLAAFNIS